MPYDTLDTGPVVSPDGQWVAAATYNEVIVRKTGDFRMRPFPTPGNHLWVTMTADSKSIVICRSNIAYLYDLESGNQTAAFYVIGGSFTALTAVSSRGEQLLVVANSNQVAIYVYDGVGWVYVKNIQGFSDISSMAVSRNNRWLSIADKTSDVLRIYNLQTMSTTPIATRTVVDVSAQAFDPASTALYVGNLAGTVTAVSTTTWNLGASFSVGGFIAKLLCSADGTQLWIGRNGRLQRRTVAGTLQFEVPNLDFTPHKMGLDVQGRLHFNGSGPRSYYVMPDDSMRIAPGHYRRIESLAVANSGTQVMTGGTSIDPSLRAWSPTGLERWWLQPDGSDIEAIAYAPTSLSVAVASSGGSSGKIKIYDNNGNQTNGAPITQTNTPYAVAYSTSLPTHGSVVAFGNGNVTRLYRVNNGTFLNDLGNHSATISAIAFSADGTRIATGGDDGLVNIFKTDGTTTWSLVTSYSMGGSIRRLAFHPSGTVLYALSSTASYGLRSLLKTSIGGVEDWLQFRLNDVDATVGTVHDMSMSRDGRVLAVSGSSTLTFINAGSFAQMLTWLYDSGGFEKIEFGATNHDLFAVRDRGLYSLKNPYPTFVSTLYVNPSAVNKGQSATLTVNLTKSAPAGGVTVLLTDYTTSVLTPASVFIPAGQYTATAQLLTALGSRAGTYTITASLFGSFVNAQITITP